jgi:YegS/Rv2252/BmrU family lipid kinase
MELDKWIMKTAVILNPTAGLGKIGPVPEKIERAMRKCGMECEIILTHEEGDGTRLARAAVARGHDLIVAAGGDGTVNEIINGLAGTNAKLGLLPSGSVNVLARDLGIPRNLVKAAQVLAKGHVKEIDLGLANDRYFALMAGIGFDAEVVANVFRPIKDIIGSSVYVFSGLEKLATYEATDIVIEMPDARYAGKAFLVMVCNVSTYTYYLKITPDAVPDDGVLDICVFERLPTDKFGFAHNIADVFLRRHMYHDEVRFFRTCRATIRSTPEVMVQLDGDVLDSTPVDISVIPRGLSLIVPEEAKRAESG